MKLHYFLIPLGIIAITALAIEVYQANSAPLPQGFPSPTSAGVIEVKTYPAYRAATYTYKGELSKAANQAFYPLYQHISSNEIPMTAPVETRYPTTTLTEVEDTGLAKVSFLYRSKDTSTKTIADEIVIEDIPSMTVVSLGCQGSYSYDSYQKGLAQLKEWLNRHQNYQVTDSPRRFFYDGPYVPDALKRSEIQIPIQKTVTSQP
ncbi:ABC transporter substrate-binding protein [Aphanothece hegewaldii CCALA 016]|uniref:ABC transporter substrate-binding protein n=1 Tax=Aphanothece hegewaldii CCALA 016 TaxID=2107694 RepID=A0A2T1LQZ5_9CHRO|nr:heme-binding protein [Aphanothece hegewaldii]PSF30494.1 ABC transporter substrate-binding protein [Aphanothece hegewaldii CCALA 016]